jgi:hypothetical protein
MHWVIVGWKSPPNFECADLWAGNVLPKVKKIAPSLVLKQMSALPSENRMLLVDQKERYGRTPQTTGSSTLNSVRLVISSTQDAAG